MRGQLTHTILRAKDKGLEVGIIICSDSLVTTSTTARTRIARTRIGEINNAIQQIKKGVRGVIRALPYVVCFYSPSPPSRLYAYTKDHTACTQVFLYASTTSASSHAASTARRRTPPHQQEQQQHQQQQQESSPDQ